MPAQRPTCARPWATFTRRLTTYILRGRAPSALDKGRVGTGKDGEGRSACILYRIASEVFLHRSVFVYERTIQLAQTEPGTYSSIMLTFSLYFFSSYFFFSLFSFPRFLSFFYPFFFMGLVCFCTAFFFPFSFFLVLVGWLVGLCVLCEFGVFAFTIF